MDFGLTLVIAEIWKHRSNGTLARLCGSMEFAGDCFSTGRERLSLERL